MGKLMDLKKCPFCGGEAQLITAPVNYKNNIPCYGVCCKKCRIMIGTLEHGKTDFFRTPYAAVSAWNGRA